MRYPAYQVYPVCIFTMLKYSAFVWLATASECGLFMLVFMLSYPSLSPSMRIVDPCRIGLASVMCAVVLCVVLVAVFGYFTAVFVQF
jgi:hypothetical protein